MSWIAETHRDHQGKPSWTRQAASFTLLVLGAALLIGRAEFGPQFVLALGIVFGIKGAQKHVESKIGNAA